MGSFPNSRITSAGWLELYTGPQLNFHAKDTPYAKDTHPSAYFGTLAPSVWLICYSMCVILHTYTGMDRTTYVFEPKYSNVTHKGSSVVDFLFRLVDNSLIRFSDLPEISLTWCPGLK